MLTSVMFKKKKRDGKPSASSGPGNPSTPSASLTDPPAPQCSQPSSNKRIWGYTDPFKFAPSEYHSGLLQVVEPFLNVRQEGVLPKFNKFAGGKMNKETIEAALRIVLPPYHSTTRVFSTAQTELNIQPHHMALLQNLYLLTRPHEDEQASEDVIEESIGVEDENVSGISIKCRGEKALNWSSNEGIDLDHEAPAEGEDDRKAKGRLDFRIFVWDKGPLKRLNLSRTEKARLRLKRMVAIVESKYDKEKDAVFQAAGYAREEILRNIKNWHLQPVYLITLAAGSWTYAIMDIHGYISLEDNKFTLEDFQRFKKQESMQPGISYKELKERLEVGLENLRDNSKEKPEAAFPNKKYLVGNFFQANEWFPLPVPYGLLVRGCGRFYEGLMRTVIGERVLQWTPEDVRRARNVQVDLEEELLSAEGLQPTLEEVIEELERQIQKRRRLEMAGSSGEAK